MFDYFLKLLDSRGSRFGPHKALVSLHADYVGGINANFRKWYFSSELDFDDSVGFDALNSNNDDNAHYCPSKAEKQWCCNMRNLLPSDCVIQIALYLLCWGEANNIRFMPECLCFIFKCCNDYYYSLDIEAPVENITPSFLDHVITPLYKFYRDQSYVCLDGIYHHNDKDHKDIIGYDDMNQLFWYKKGLERLIVDDNKTRLLSLLPKDRYVNLSKVLWNKAFYKTFKERRSWSHVFTNFNRIWVIHLSVFWYYTSFNSPTLYTSNYQQVLDNQPTTQARLAVMSLAGGIASFICLVSVLLELIFVPRMWKGSQSVVRRSCVLAFSLALNLGPSIYLLAYYPLNFQDKNGLIVSICLFIFSIFTVLYLSVVPLGGLFGSHTSSAEKRISATENFAAGFRSFEGTDRIASCGLWITIFTMKFLESYFFLTLSIKDPIRELSTMKINNCTDEILFGRWFCLNYALILLGMIYLTDLVLFFLDTYLWYIFWNTMFSVIRTFYSGFSIWTPWRNIFTKLPKRIFSKIIASSNNKDVEPRVLVSQIWNSIIISMYREHLLSLEHVQRLIYKEMNLENDGGLVLSEPALFISQEEQSMKSNLFYEESEAQRRVLFFAQSLSVPMPSPLPTNKMPSFTVLVPHYKEKVTLSLREIIREEESYSHVTMLEYLKLLHPLEWACFVKDTKMLAEEYDIDENYSSKETSESLQYEPIGFKVATPEYILRTRIWASLRSQTLYRTISGFMNYSRAIKLLFDVENPDIQKFKNKYTKLEEASVSALQKFRLVVSMQRFKSFTAEERENKEFLLRAYPELQIAYIDEEIDEKTGDSVYYSVLIDGSSVFMENGEREPKYRIKLSGNPILGDGKSDNQNHSVIFCRGEYIQLVDANQDNYLEECLKIKSVLAEFEETEFPLDPYSDNLEGKQHSKPVAIVGTREYIFSENIGILGDVAAGKEQTFGTLFARTLAHIGGKLHYGHPDFLNSIFMTTRGGLSKGQKGLHLNEDIYAGMNAILRGGRIKHCEYMQCGKGRDLGFSSILNFTTKIGTGMGEQMLSREYFYLSTQLPLDRFLSFYYAHPGFHLNNVFIILSIKLLLLVGVNLATLADKINICDYNKSIPITNPRRPIGCYNIMPIVLWFERCILSIFIAFSVSFVPLWMQEQTERGVYRAITRLGKHFVSLSPLFEIFVCRIYAHSLVSDIAIGGARYIATGRGFATMRVPFFALYSRFASDSLYFGFICGLSVLYCSMKMWRIPLLYFWVTIIGLLICPCLYNPNQFNWNEFILDYKDYLTWLYRGNSRTRTTSWIGYTKLKRSRITGFKLYKCENSGGSTLDDNRPSRWNLIISQAKFPLIEIIFLGCAYIYVNSENETRNSMKGGSILRIALLSFGPILINMSILFIFFSISCVIGFLGTLVLKKFPAVLSAIVYVLAVLNQILTFEMFWYLHDWDFSRTVLGSACSILIQNWTLQIISVLFLSREFRHDKSNRAWWSGNWYKAELGSGIFTQPFREFICKTTELSYFAGDIFLGHIILFSQIPILLIPYIDRWHTLMLFWLESSNQLRSPMFSKRHRHIRRINVVLYTGLFLTIFILSTSIIVLPIIITRYVNFDFDKHIPDNLRLKQISYLKVDLQNSL